MKKTKIVATIGPITENEEALERLVLAGMNVMRLNFSHGTHDEHKKRIILGKKVRDKLKMPLAILQDLSGPKIRIGDFSTDSVNLIQGQKFTLTSDKIIGDSEKVSLNYPNILNEVKPKEKIFMNDGKQKLEIVKVNKNEIICKILIGGNIKSRRGLNFPDSDLSLSSLTEKDKLDLKFGLENDIDFVALSFVRSENDVIELKDLLKMSNAQEVKIISKIETPQAVKNFDKILEVSDAIMVARGDLAVEIPPEEVPVIQKKLIEKCNLAGKPVITATQMLSSMVSSAVPTRAEISDIANAILDGTDAVMLSEETTIGQHYEEAVKIMKRVALHTEKYFHYESILEKNNLNSKNITNSISYSAVNILHNLNAKAIVALSVSGYTARMISRYKPSKPIIVITPNEKTYHQMALSFNCFSFKTKMLDSISKSIEKSKEIVLENKFANNSDLIVICAGLPFSQPGNTNMLLVQQI